MIVPGAALQAIAAALPILLLAACAMTQSRAETRADPDPRLRDVHFMQGAWQATAPDGTVTDEHWGQAAAATMMGTSRTRKGDRTVFFEFLRLEARADGVYYLASPGGRNPPTPFKLTSAAPGRAVFENPEHDFPTKITYWLDDDGALNARVEGKDPAARSESWTYLPIDVRR